MNMTVTESDKRLLSFLAAFLILLLFIFLVWKPLREKNDSLEKEIVTAKDQQIVMDLGASLAEDVEVTEANTKEQRTQALQRFYKTLQSQDAESMATILMLNHKLSVQSLTITMPEKETDLKWYQYAEEADRAVDSGDAAENDFGIYGIRIVASADGSKENALALLDDIAENYPAISVLNAEWSTETMEQGQMVTAQAYTEEEDTEDTEEAQETAAAVLRASGTEMGSLSVTLEIYMCEQ